MGKLERIGLVSFKARSSEEIRSWWGVGVGEDPEHIRENLELLRANAGTLIPCP